MECELCFDTLISNGEGERVRVLKKTPLVVFHKTDVPGVLCILRMSQSICLIIVHLQPVAILLDITEFEFFLNGDILIYTASEKKKCVFHAR